MALKEIDITKLDRPFIDMIGNQWMLITSGDKDSFNMMTASWGFMGYVWGYPAAAVMLRPTRYTKQWIDRTHSYTLTFFPKPCRKQLAVLGTKSGRDMDKMHDSGLTPIELPGGQMSYKEATLTIVCEVAYAQEMKEECLLDKKVMPDWYPKGPSDLHTLYIGRITAAYLHTEE